MMAPYPDRREVDRARIAPAMATLDAMSGQLLELVSRLDPSSADARELLGVATRMRVELRMVARHLWPEAAD